MWSDQRNGKEDSLGKVKEINTEEIRRVFFWNKEVYKEQGHLKGQRIVVLVIHLKKESMFYWIMLFTWSWIHDCSFLFSYFSLYHSNCWSRVWKIPNKKHVALFIEDSSHSIWFIYRCKTSWPWGQIEWSLIGNIC